MLYNLYLKRTQGRQLLWCYFEISIRKKSSQLYKSYCRILSNDVKYFDALTIISNITEGVEDSAKSVCCRFKKNAVGEKDTHNISPSKCSLPHPLT